MTSKEQIRKKLARLEKEAQAAADNLAVLNSQIATLRYELEHLDKVDPSTATGEHAPEVNMRQLEAIERCYNLPHRSLCDQCSVFARKVAEPIPPLAGCSQYMAEMDTLAMPIDKVLKVVEKVVGQEEAKELLGWITGVGDASEDLKDRWVAYTLKRLHRSWSIAPPVHMIALAAHIGPSRLLDVLEDHNLDSLKNLAKTYGLDPEGHKGRRSTYVKAIKDYLASQPYRPAEWLRSPHQDLMVGPQGL